MDDIEHADKQYQTHFAARLKEVRRQNALSNPIDPNTLKPIPRNPGRVCFQCPAPTVSDDHRWCSVECRTIWSRENE
jgi:hypothetical protein